MGYEDLQLCLKKLGSELSSAWIKKDSKLILKKLSSELSRVWINDEVQTRMKERGALGAGERRNL